MAGMRNFQDTIKIRKRSFIIGFSICMTVPLKKADALFVFLYEIVLFKFFIAVTVTKIAAPQLIFSN